MLNASLHGLVSDLKNAETLLSLFFFFFFIKDFKGNNRFARKTTKNDYIQNGYVNVYAILWGEWPGS